MFVINLTRLGMDNVDDLREDFVGKSAEQRAKILIDEGEYDPVSSEFAGYVQDDLDIRKITEQEL